MKRLVGWLSSLALLGCAACAVGVVNDNSGSPPPPAQSEQDSGAPPPSGPGLQGGGMDSGSRAADTGTGAAPDSGRDSAPPRDSSPAPDTYVPPPPPQDASSGGGCGSYALPNTSANCSACTQGSGNCQPNGCYNGYLCDTTSDYCVDPTTVNCDAGM